MKFYKKFYLKNNIKLIYLLLLIANSFFYSSIALSTKNLLNPLEVEKQNISKEIDFILGKLKSSNLNEIPIDLSKNVNLETENQLNKDIQTAMEKDPILMEFGKLDENLDTYLNHFENTSASNKNKESKKKNNKKDSDRGNNDGEVKKMKDLHDNIKKISKKLNSDLANKANNSTKAVKKNDNKNANKDQKAFIARKGKVKNIANRINLNNKHISQEKNEINKLKELNERKAEKKSNKKEIGKNKENNKLINKADKAKKSSNKGDSNKKINSQKINIKDNDDKDIEIIDDDFSQNFDKLAEQNIQRLNNTEKDQEEADDKSTKHLHKSDFVDEDDFTNENNSEKFKIKNKTEAVSKKIKNVPKENKNDGKNKHKQNKKAKSEIQKLSNKHAEKNNKNSNQTDYTVERGNIEKFNKKSAKKQKLNKAKIDNKKKNKNSTSKKTENLNTNFSLANSKKSNSKQKENAKKKDFIHKASEDLIDTLEEDFNNLNELETEINKTNNQISNEINKITTDNKIDNGEKIEKILGLVSSVKSLINQENKIVNMKKNLLQRIYYENSKNAENIKLIKSQIAKNLNTNKKEKSGFDVNKILDILSLLKNQIESAPSNSAFNKDENTNKISNKNSPLVNNYIIINKNEIDSAFDQEGYPLEEEIIDEDEIEKEKSNSKKELKSKPNNEVKDSYHNNKNKNELIKKNKVKKIKAKKSDKSKIMGKKVKKDSLNISNSTNIEIKAKKSKIKISKKQNKKEAKKNDKEKKTKKSKDEKANYKKENKKKKQKIKQVKNVNANLKNKTKTISTNINTQFNNKTEIKPSANKTENLEEEEEKNKKESLSESELSDNNKTVKTKSERSNISTPSNKTDTQSILRSEQAKINNNNTNQNTTKIIPSFLEARSHKMKSRKFKNKKPLMEFQSKNNQNNNNEIPLEAGDNTSKSVLKNLLELKHKLKHIASSIGSEINETQIAELFENAKTEISKTNLFSSKDAKTFQNILSKEEFELSDVEILKNKSFKLNNLLEIISDFYKHLTQSVAKIKNEFSRKKLIEKIKRSIDYVQQLKSLSIMYMRSLHVLNKNVLSKTENDNYLSQLTQKLVEIKHAMQDYFVNINSKQKPVEADIINIKDYRERMNNYLDLYKSIKIRNNNILESNSLMRKIIETNSNILKEDTLVKILESV